MSTYTELFNDAISALEKVKHDTDPTGRFYKYGEQVLWLRLASMLYRYDFMNRILFVGDNHVMPFNQLDREVLDAMRQKLIDMGGNPLPLAAMATDNQPPKASPIRPAV